MYCYIIFNLVCFNYIYKEASSQTKKTTSINCPDPQPTCKTRLGRLILLSSAKPPTQHEQTPPPDRASTSYYYQLIRAEELRASTICCPSDPVQTYRATSTALLRSTQLRKMHQKYPPICSWSFGFVQGGVIGNNSKRVRIHMDPGKKSMGIIGK